MGAGQKSQFRGRPGQGSIDSARAPVVRELIVPNPKLKLLDQVREVMRLRHYSIRTEQCYCDWIRRYIKFHGMRSREELAEVSGGKLEMFLSDLAVNGNVSASTQNQAFNAIGPRSRQRQSALTKPKQLRRCHRVRLAGAPSGG
jgi:hypothetical protein